MERECNKAGHSRYWGLGLGLALWCAGLVGVAGAAAPITEFPLPPGAYSAGGLTAGPDGALWFTEFEGNSIGRITTDGTITEFSLPTGSAPGGLTAGPDGALWFTAFSGNSIGRITTAGTITEYSLPTLDSRPSSITAGPDGALWFTAFSSNTIGRITTVGTITEFSLPTLDSYPISITTGPDGALWFVEQGANKIGRITTAGTITEFPVPTAIDTLHAITAGPDGALWFTETATSFDNRVGRITTAGTITEFPIPTTFSDPTDITAGPDGALWFTEPGANKIGRITTAGTITEFPVPTAYSRPTDITAGPDGALWFTEPGTNKIGRLVPDRVGSAVVSLNGSEFHMEQTMSYQANLAPGPEPTQVDIYLGALLPDGVTFVSLMQVSPGVISFVLGPSPIPFSANVALTEAVIPFSYTFNGFEPVGTYLMYAGIVIAGSNPLLPENQLALSMQSFQFSSDVCVSVSVSGLGSVRTNPQGTNGGPTCDLAFAPGTTVTLTAQGGPSFFNSFADFFGWGGDCTSAGTHATCTLVMTTNKSVSASFECPLFLCGYL